MSKRAAMLLFTLTASSLLMVNFASVLAQSKPSVPEFTVEFEGIQLKIKIKNQPNVSYYNIRVKLHSSDQWHELFGPRRGDGEPNYAEPSDSEYTVMLIGDVFPPSGKDRPSSYLYVESHTGNFEGLEVPSDDQVDFQVEAMTGQFISKPAMPASITVFSGEYSGWSETQTITAPVLTPTPAPLNETIKTAAPLLAVIVAALIIGVAAALLRHNKPKQTQAPLSRWQ
jgi:hypothetical protein